VRVHLKESERYVLYVKKHTHTHNVIQGRPFATQQAARTGLEGGLHMRMHLRESEMYEFYVIQETKEKKRKP